MPSKFKFKCVCGQKILVADDMAGRSVYCPACGKTITVPPPNSKDVVPVATLVDAGKEAEKFFSTCDCGQKLRVKKETIGRKIFCPSCRNQILIRAEGTKTAPAPPKSAPAKKKPAPAPPKRAPAKKKRAKAPQKEPATVDASLDAEEEELLQEILSGIDADSETGEYQRPQKKPKAAAGGEELDFIPLADDDE